MKKVFHIALFLFAFYACKETPVENPENDATFEVLSSEDEYTAGDNIQLQFLGKKTAVPHLWLGSTFGSTLILPILEEDKFVFTLPNSFSEKAGICNWKLLNNKITHAEGRISIRPKTDKIIEIASFLGPKSISAGGNDFSMLVVAPTDIYDNPLLENTPIAISHQFDTKIENDSTNLKNGIAWKNIYSTEQAGRMAITALCEDKGSKEMTVMVKPAKAIDFGLAYSRNHNYADGNQIINFSTDIIKDEFENVITDGTLVSFIIKNSQGILLKTSGTTINGIAQGRLLHPNQPENWSITAYITGAAKSNTVVLDFEPAVKDFQVVYSSNGRNIQIEEMQSFMHQLVPDGFPVILEIKNQKGILLDTLRSTSRLGHAEFYLSKDFYPNSTYTIAILAAGITKKKSIVLR